LEKAIFAKDFARIGEIYGYKKIIITLCAIYIWQGMEKEYANDSGESDSETGLP